VALARKLFRAVMATAHMKEECDYQFVTPADAEVLTAGDMAGSGLTSGYVDAALTMNITAARAGSVLFGAPMHDDVTTGVNADFGFGLLINKKSPCALELQRVWNAGLAEIIGNGTYACLVDECGDDSFTPWEVSPTSCTHSDLMALVVYPDCGDEDPEEPATPPCGTTPACGTTPTC
jgi:hypothetical protein